MRRFDMNTGKNSAVVVIAALACLASGSVVAQIGNPWNPNAEVAATAPSRFAAPASRILPAQATAASRYAPADLEQRLSAVKRPQPVAPPPVPQMGQPQGAPIQPPVSGQPNPYPAGQQYQAPVANGYPNNSYAPQYGYGAPQQGYNGYPPGYGQGGYNNYGTATPYGPGNYPGGVGGYMPFGGVPGGGSSPFNFSPFGFF